jgi:membrane protein DedA with SNARE-associated domain
MTDGLISKFGYLGIVLLLVLGGLGVPIPEEAPVILSAVLSHKGVMWWPFAFAACFVGVLVGDFLVYYLGYFYGEKVLSLRLTRSFLTRSREAQIKGYFHRHGIKILIVGRFAVGFRTAAYLTAGILRLPALRLLGADMIAATLSTTLMFAGGYWFADWIEKGIKEAQHFIVITLVASVAGVILYRYIKARRRAGLRVGPPVLVSPDDLPLPPDDLSPSTIQRNRPRERGASGGSSSTIVPAPAVASVPSPPSPSGATVETNGVAAMGPGSGSGSATPSPRASTTAGP